MRKQPMNRTEFRNHVYLNARKAGFLVLEAWIYTQKTLAFWGY